MDYRIGLFVLIVLALDIWAIAKIARGQGGTGKKVLWVVAILALPLLGLFLWALLGPAVHEPQMYEDEPP